MSACLLVDGGAVSLLPDTAPDSCMGYVVVTPAEYKSNQNAFADFDYETFGTVLVFLMATAISGFVGGFVVRKLRL